MCEVCDEFGRLGCPACEKTEETPATFHCRWCGKDCPDEDAVKYRGDWYCPDCYACEKEDDEAFAAEFLAGSVLFQTMKLF
jgi:hypothetical protein